MCVCLWVYIYTMILYLQLGNHDRSRVASEYGGRLIDAMNLITLTLPGVKIVYQVRILHLIDILLTKDKVNKISF